MSSVRIVLDIVFISIFFDISKRGLICIVFFDIAKCALPGFRRAIVGTRLKRGMARAESFSLRYESFSLIYRCLFKVLTTGDPVLGGNTWNWYRKGFWGSGEVNFATVHTSPQQLLYFGYSFFALP